MNNGFNNIHVNPNFIPKSQPKIYVNPTFVCPKQPDDFSNQDLYFPIYENGTENIDHNSSCPSYLHNTKIVGNYIPDTIEERSLQPCQSYSDQYSNVFLEKSSQSSNDSIVQYKSKNYISANYMDLIKVDKIVATERDLTYAVSGVSSHQINSKICKPVAKPVIMGQRMIKNQQVCPSRTKYSLDYRMPMPPLQEKPVSSFVKANNLFNKPNNLVLKDIKEKAASSIHKVQVLQSPPSSVSNFSTKSYLNINGIFSNSSNMKNQFSKLNTKTSKDAASISSKTTPNHSPTFESRSTIFKSSMKLIRSDTLRKSAKYIREDILVKKRKYAVKTKTKLIRRNSSGSKYPKFTSVSRLSKLRRSLRLKKGTLLKAREKIIANYSRPATVPLNPKYTPFKSKYKFLKNQIISRYKLNRNPQPKSTPTKNSKPAWSSKSKRNPKKSDKFINISGSLYKSTATSLKKHEISPKKKTKTLSPKIRSKKFSFRNSKFVYRRQNSCAKLESGTLIEIVRRKKLAQFKRVNDFCFFYNKYGKCKKQNKGCPFIHDPTRIAICTRFLQGSCTKVNCPFSHFMDRNKMPVCSHFQEGSCSKEGCQYRHVRVNPKAPVCKSFLKGHCPHGDECKKKHILICEDFNKGGNCPRGKKCPLSHRSPKPKSNTFKKEKNVTGPKKLKPKTKNGKKVGVLGLVCNDKTEVKDQKISSSSNNRYFVCSDDATDVQHPVERSDHLPTNQDVAVDADFEQKRERLFRKVESMKRSYRIGIGIGQEDCENDSQMTIQIPPLSTTEDDHFSHQESFKIRYFPLPDVMPSYIPLVIPHD